MGSFQDTYTLNQPSRLVYEMQIMDLRVLEKNDGIMHKSPDHEQNIGAL